MPQFTTAAHTVRPWHPLFIDLGFGVAILETGTPFDSTIIIILPYSNILNLFRLFHRTRACGVGVCFTVAACYLLYTLSVLLIKDLYAAALCLVGKVRLCNISIIFRKARAGLVRK